MILGGLIVIAIGEARLLHLRMVAAAQADRDVDFRAPLECIASYVRGTLGCCSNNRYPLPFSLTSSHTPL